MSSQFPDLGAAVRQLYDAFAGCPGSPRLNDFCLHCVSSQEAEELASTPLHDLRADLAHLFVTNAVAWTWGRPDDLWPYLPRILELAAEDEFSNADIDDMFFALRERWPDRPQGQRDAVASYLAALWQATVTRGWSHGPRAFTLLEAALSLGLPVDSWPSAWETVRGEDAALRLANFIDDCCSEWDDDPTAGWPEPIGQWATGPVPQRILTPAVAAASTPQIAEFLSTRLNFLNSLAKSDR